MLKPEKKTRTYTAPSRGRGPRRIVVAADVPEEYGVFIAMRVKQTGAKNVSTYIRELIAEEMTRQA